MYKKEFRHSLLEILDKAGVPQNMLREKFIRLSWHKYNNISAPLFHDTKEKNACNYVLRMLKKTHLYAEYRVFIGDPFFCTFINKKE